MLCMIAWTSEQNRSTNRRYSYLASMLISIAYLLQTTHQPTKTYFVLVQRQRVLRKLNTRAVSGTFTSERGLKAIVGKQFKVVDVGGQRSERRKWVHCFEDVTAIIFVVSMGGYDEGMIEDHSTNQMLDAYEMFTAITASRWFTNTTFILFLNKYDVFENKIKTRDLKDFFPRYDGPAKDVAAAGEWIRKMFQSCDRRPGASIFTTFTTATDTDLVKRLMPAVNDQILRSNLREAAFI